jgi:hypothetical protein
MNPVMITNAVGMNSWTLDGKLHRTDGPAIEAVDGHKSWWVHDKRHRSDGPAIEWANGDASWYLNNEKLTFEKWLEQSPRLSEEEKVMLKLKYG